MATTKAHQETIAAAWAAVFKVGFRISAEEYSNPRVMQRISAMAYENRANAASRFTDKKLSQRVMAQP
jgi:hypothetical protein